MFYSEFSDQRAYNTDIRPHMRAHNLRTCARKIAICGPVKNCARKFEISGPHQNRGPQIANLRARVIFLKIFN